MLTYSSLNSFQSARLGTAFGWLRSRLPAGLALALLVGVAGGPWGCTASNEGYCGVSGLCDVGDGDMAATGDDGGDPGRHDLANPDLGGGKDDGGVVDRDPNVAGPWKTISFDIQVPVTGGTTQGTVIGPSDDNATISLHGAPYPTVVLSPGVFQDRKKYQHYGDRLASYGIVTVLQKVQNEGDHARYRDNTEELINWLLKPTGPTADKLKGRLDEKRLGLVGHSLGGKVSILVAALDSRIKALIAIDPVDLNMPPAASELAKIKLPGSLPLGLLGETTSSMGGGFACAPAAANYQMLYGKANPPAFAITFLGAAHLDFLDACDAGCANFCPGGTAPRDRTNSLAVKYVAAYFIWGLLGQAGASKYLDGSELKKDVDLGYVTQVSK